MEGVNLGLYPKKERMEMKLISKNLRLLFFTKCVFLATLLLLTFVENSFAGNLGGSTSYFAFQPFNNVFYDQQYARGVVRMDNGFTLVHPSSGVQSTHGASVYMDTCVSVSGAIDLRNTNTIILQSDLHLDNGVTFSSGGRIYGYDRAVILGGDLTIPANNVIHIGGRIVIDGRGNKLILGKSAQLFVDAGSTLTLRNLVLQNTQNNPGNPPILCGAGGTAAYCSNLCLDNVELALASNFYFNSGQMFIHNDVAVTGTSALVYRSCQPSFITSGAHLYFDAGTTFSFCPSTFTDCPYTFHSTYTASNFIHMADATSMIVFEGSSFFTTTTGLRLTIGTVLFDNRVSLQSKASFDINLSTPVTYINQATTGTLPYSVAWSPDGRFVAVVNDTSGNLQIFSITNGVLSTNPVGTATVGVSPWSVAWSPDGRFLAVGNSGTSTLQIYSFIGGVLNSTAVGSVTLGLSGLDSVSWSPDGRFIATVNGSYDTLYVFNFNGSGNPILVGTATTGNTPWSVAWSPDGRFVTVINYSGSLQIFSITNGVPSTNPVGTLTVGTGLYSVSWSPDGRFLAIANFTSNTLQILRFYGGNPILVGTATTGFGPSSVSWSPDGRFVAVVEVIGTLQIFSVSGGAPSTNPIGTVSAGSTPYSVSWSLDGRYIAVINQSSTTVQIFRVNYIVSQTPQALSNSIVFGNSALGSSYDATVRGLSGSQMAIDGLINYDCVS